MSWASVAMLPVYGTGLMEVREPLQQARLRAPGVALAAREQGRGRGHAGPHPGPEVGPDAALDGRGAAVGVEAGDVQPEAFGTLPQVRVLEAPLVGEQRVMHGP